MENTNDAIKLKEQHFPNERGAAARMLHDGLPPQAPAANLDTCSPSTA